MIVFDNYMFFVCSTLCDRCGISSFIPLFQDNLSLYWLSCNQTFFRNCSFYPFPYSPLLNLFLSTRNMHPLSLSVMCRLYHVFSVTVHVKVIKLHKLPYFFLFVTPHPLSSYHRSPNLGPIWMSRSPFGWENLKRFLQQIMPHSIRHSVMIGKSIWLSNIFPLR